MRTAKLIDRYIAGQPEAKRDEMVALHRLIQSVSPGCELWFLDGRDESGKVISNPNIGYGRQTIRSAGGKSREFYRIGLSANTTGVSIYIIGIEDKGYLAERFKARLGKARVTGYCIKFRRLGDIDMAALEDVVRFGFEDRQAG